MDDEHEGEGMKALQFMAELEAHMIAMNVPPDNEGCYMFLASQEFLDELHGEVEPLLVTRTSNQKQNRYKVNGNWIEAARIGRIRVAVRDNGPTH